MMGVEGKGGNMGAGREGMDVWDGLSIGSVDSYVL